MSGERTPRRNRLRWSLASLKSESTVKRQLSRRLLLLPQGHPVPWLTSRHWTPYTHTSPRTRTNALRASSFVGTLASSLPTRPVLHHQTKDSLSTRTGSLPPNNHVPAVATSPLNIIPTAETSTKALSKVALSSRKGGVEEEIIEGNRTESLLVGGKLSRYRTHWSELLPQFPEIVKKTSHGILISFYDKAPSLLYRPLELPSNHKTSDLLHALKKLSGHQRSDGPFVSGILQLPISSPQARRHLQAHHRPQEIKSLSGHFFVQNGNAVLNHSSSSTSRMDYKNRPQRCLTSHSSSCEHPLCYSWKDLSVSCSPIWSLNEFTKTLAPVVQLLRTQGIRVHAYLDDWIICADSPDQSRQHT